MNKKIISVFAVCMIAFSTFSVSAKEPVASAVFAGGCFWCLESDFDKLPGIISTISGYSGGDEVNPTYEQVSRGVTGHFESVKVTYNPTVVSYSELVNYFWKHIDPTDAQGQFCDKGKQYRAAIFYQNDEEKLVAQSSKAQLLKAGTIKNIVTLILPFKSFYPAEEYHQDYYKKNPVRYHYYRHRCGRDQRIKNIWG